MPLARGARDAGRRSLRRLFLALALSLGSSAAHAEPSDRATCTTAYDQGQRLRRQNSLVESRAQLLICARDPCPASLQPDCSRWLGEVEHLVPSLVVSVRRDDGTDVKDARVFIDGQLRAEHLDGLAMDVNPGEHAVRVEVDAVVLQQTILTNVAEKGRAVSFRLSPPAPAVAIAPPPPAPARAAPPPPATESRRTIGWPSYALAGLGVVGLGMFTGFALQGESRYRHLEHCRPACNPNDVDSARASYRTADIGLVVGVLALAGAVVVYFTQTAVTTTTTAAR